MQLCHPVSGMNPEYGEFDGTPMSRPLKWTTDRHDCFYSDAYRTAANIGLDHEWCGNTQAMTEAVKRLQYTLGVVNKEDPYVTYEVDGTPLEQRALHPIGILATTAQASLAVDGPLSLDDPDPAKALAAQWVERFWNEPLRKGVRRYYDNCLYLFAFLALSGKYRMW